MSEATTYVGLDVHKKEISIAVVLPGVEKPLEWSCKNEPRAVRRLARRLKREAEGDLRVVYEAGPCGYVLQRQFSSEGVRAEVIAPSLIPVKPGDRIKTDRRDARKLATLERGGQLTVVHPPSESEESVRDLCRCREDAVEDLRRARQRLVKMLLRRGFVYRSGNNWTRRHRVWLRGLEFEHEASQTVFEDYLSAIELLEQRMRGLETRIEEISVEEPYREPVGWLRCFRGIDTVSAMILVTELHGFDRFSGSSQAHGVLGFGLSGRRERGSHAPGTDHQGRQRSRASHLDRSRVALPTPARCGSCSTQTTRGSTPEGLYCGRQGAASVASSLSPFRTGLQQAGSQGCRCDRSRARRLPVGCSLPLPATAGRHRHELTCIRFLPWSIL